MSAVHDSPSGWWGEGWEMSEARPESISHQYHRENRQIHCGDSSYSHNLCIILYLLYLASSELWSKNKTECAHRDSDETCQEIRACVHYVKLRNRIINLILMHLYFDTKNNNKHLNNLQATESLDWRLWVNYYMSIVLHFLHCF